MSMYVGKRKPLEWSIKRVFYWKDFGAELSRHDDVNNMHSWFKKLLKPRPSLSKQEEEAKVTKNSASHASTSPSSTSTLHSLSSSSPRTTPSKLQQLPFALNSELRWKRKYDVFVCHSSAHSDIEEATSLVSFLEASPLSLRCFLWQRDTCPGGAISTEFCQAVQNSHLRVLLITPSFVQDDWCNYMMHQALAEGPMSNRMIPLVQNLSYSQYPQELKFYYYIDLSKNPHRGYNLVGKTALKFLDDLVKKEKILDCTMDGSTGGLDGECSSQKDKMMPEYDPAGAPVPSGNDAEER